MRKCICEDCKYFIQHYSFDNGFASKLFCGHCNKHNRHYKLNYARTECEQFEQNDKLIKAIMRKKIISTLNEVEQKLEDLKQFIQKDA